MGLVKDLLFRKPLANCGCNTLARQMDAWGVEGCEQRFDEIVDAVTDNAVKSSTLGWGHLGRAAIRSKVAEKVREAIERARQGLPPKGKK